MTIIVAKDGVMAADRGRFSGGFMTSDRAAKIHRSRDGAVGAACGASSACDEFGRWFVSTSRPSQRQRAKEFMMLEAKIGTEKDPVAALWIEPDGSIWQWESDDRIPERAIEEFVVLGEGSVSDVARGAMLMDATPYQAVALCVRHCVYAAGHPQVEGIDWDSARAALAREVPEAAPAPIDPDARWPVADSKWPHVKTMDGAEPVPWPDGSISDKMAVPYDEDTPLAPPEYLGQEQGEMIDPINDWRDRMGLR